MHWQLLHFSGVTTGELLCSSYCLFCGVFPPSTEAILGGLHLIWGIAFVLAYADRDCVA